MSRDCDIDFLGVFDTVASVGVIIPRALPFSTHNGKTRVFRHALALDEHRAKFRQETWHWDLTRKTFTWYDYVLNPFDPLYRAKRWLIGETKAETEAKRRARVFEKNVNKANKGEEARKTDIKEVSKAAWTRLCDVTLILIQL
jgi:uncharacterized protein (DUF2235 family)